MTKKNQPKIDPDVCVRCANCMAVCPVSRVTPKFPGPKQAGPGAERFRKPDEPSVDEWIDLCIGCGLCDLACSSGVNISDLNLKARAKYLDEKGRPLRDWVLTHPSFYGRLGSQFSSVVNPILKNSKLRGAINGLLQIDKNRELPPYQSPTFKQWFKGHRGHTPHDGRKIGYFYGCYTDTNEVDVGKAVVEVLEKNGFEVVLPRQKCCGIPMLGNGDFKAAKKQGSYNIPSLLSAVRKGLDIVFSSTSCGHMIKHDYSELLSIPGSEEVANHTFDVFEFLRNSGIPEDLGLGLKKVSIKAAYFAPCHLRSLGIGYPALEILRLVPGLEIENIEADCCGMGGTFGFKKEKMEISREIGKDLKKAVDRLKPEMILTDCEGCRLQIRHLTGLKVLHPIQILRDAIVN